MHSFAAAECYCQLLIMLSYRLISLPSSGRGCAHDMSDEYTAVNSAMGERLHDGFPTRQPRRVTRQPLRLSLACCLTGMSAAGALR